MSGLPRRVIRLSGKKNPTVRDFITISGRGTVKEPASRQLHHRLRTASAIRVTISLSIATGVAKFSRANPA
jgi:hypothetical protein